VIVDGRNGLCGALSRQWPSAAATVLIACLSAPCGALEQSSTPPDTVEGESEHGSIPAESIGPSEAAAQARAASAATPDVAAASAAAQAAEEQSGANALDTAEPLMQLGEAQLAAGDLASAELSFARSIGALEAHLGPLHRRLIRPLHGLGMTYVAMQDPARASAILERAIQVVRRNRGLFDPSQMELLEVLATNRTELGSVDAAKQDLEYMVRIAEQSWGFDDPRVAYPLSVLARWHSELLQYEPAESYYQVAIERVETSAGKDDPALVEPLLGLARNELRAFRLGDPVRAREQREATRSWESAWYIEQRDTRPGNRRVLTKDGGRALERALEIVQAQPVSDVQKLETLLLAGDWRLARGDTDEAQRLYTEAAAIVAGEPSVASTPDAEFDSAPLGYPSDIFIPLPREAYQHRELAPERVIETYALAEFTVTPAGSVRDIVIVESTANERDARKLVQALEAAVFRPRYENGSPVATTGVRHRQTFRNLRPQT